MPLSNHLHLDIRFPLQRLLTAAALAVLLVSSEDSAIAAPFDDLLNSLQPTADVNDFAGILTPDERSALENRCRGLRERTGAQLAVVVLRSLEGGEIDDFTVKLFKRWEVGKSGQDNGVMLLVAIEDRKARIEVGYGLEPILTDATSGRILREQLFPQFREQRYYEGLSAAVDRIISIIERNEPASAVPTEGVDRGVQPDFGSIVALIFFVVNAGFSFASGGFLRKGNIGSSLSSLRLPLLVVVASRFMRLPWGVFWWLIGSGLIAGVLGFMLDFASDTGRKRQRSSRQWWDSDGGSWSGGGFGGGFGGGGGFSGGGSWGGFGGGRSGGGGASGGW